MDGREKVTIDWMVRDLPELAVGNFLWLDFVPVHRITIYSILEVQVKGEAILLIAQMVTREMKNPECMYIWSNDRIQPSDQRFSLQVGLQRKP